MKNTQGKKSNKTLAAAVGLLTMVLASSLVGCNKMSFKGGAEDSAPQATAVVPETPPVLPIMPDPMRKAGACQDQQNVNSCLKCAVPTDPPPVPAALTKAEKLARIMALSCSIYNKSYPNNYQAPSTVEIYHHVLACTAEVYPETKMTAAQSSLIDTLMDPNNDSMRQTMFKGLWYRPPYTDQFALYFGLENRDAAYLFCLNSGSLAGPLVTDEYAKALLDNYETWLADSAAQARWRTAQAQRAQLVACLNKPAKPQPAKPLPGHVEHGCEYKTFEGIYEIGGRDEIQNYIAAGFKVSVESPNHDGGKACNQLGTVPDVGTYTGVVKIAGVKCH